ncbi:MAG TPA: hypothetical protein VEK79_06750 [Thermoanaerobaculia bacterium]|nr:hypothetical protein [Thermoanaerobaculia bacterium]
MLQASDEESRRHEIERLVVDHARPTIEMVLARFAASDRVLRRDESEDVMSTVTLRLVRKLQAAGQDAIEDFENYVATLTYHTIYDFMRRRFPERTRLKNRIRYLLQHDRRFAMWRSGDTILCGLKRWEGRTDRCDDVTIERDTATAAMLDDARPDDAVAAIFACTSCPLPLEMLVRMLADLWQVTEAGANDLADNVVAHPSHAGRHETRQYLEVLWSEIERLQPSHRAALLLNLRDADGMNAVALFVLVGVARFEEIAAAIGVEIAELEALWGSLPLDDQTIAARLHLTRQQVINLRRTARERLARRTLQVERYERRRG